MLTIMLIYAQIMLFYAYFYAFMLTLCFYAFMLGVCHYAFFYASIIGTSQLCTCVRGFSLVGSYGLSTIDHGLSTSIRI